VLDAYDATPPGKKKKLRSSSPMPYLDEDPFALASDDDFGDIVVDDWCVNMFYH